MVYSQQAVRDSIRNAEGKRVFYLGSGDRLTEEAREYLRREGIQILPAQTEKPQRYPLLSGGFLEEKKEQFTHLHGDVLVLKTHPRIAFRGAMDSLEAELLVCGAALPRFQEPLEEILTHVRQLLRCEVLNEPVKEITLCGLSAEELRTHSHRPQDYYGQPHFMPQMHDGTEILLLNRVRTAARSAELVAVRAFLTPEGALSREDIVKSLNRLSSMLYILMIRAKAGQGASTNHLQ